MNKVSFRLTFAEALEIGVKNAPSIIGCVVLWLLTIWVPYINVGTTIAINMLPTLIPMLATWPNGVMNFYGSLYGDSVYNAFASSGYTSL